MKKKLLMAGTLGLALAVSASAQAIDSFDTLHYVEVDPVVGATNWSSLAAAEALGGERDLRVHRVGAGIFSLSGDVGLSLPNTVSLACGFGVIGSLHLIYDGPDNSDAVDFTGLGGLDLTSAGAYDTIEFASASDLGAVITITVYQDATHYSSFSTPVAADPTFTFVSHAVAFTDFIAAGPDGGADFTQVGAIDFEIGDGPEGADISVQIIGLTGPPPPPPGDDDDDDFCQKTQGYWKNHEDEWPVFSLTLGAVTYTQAELLDLFDQAPQGNASLILAHQLIATLLNLASGSDPATIQEIVDEANDLLSQFAGSLPYDVPKCSPERALMIQLAAQLDTYNNSCKEGCSDPCGCDNDKYGKKGCGDDDDDDRCKWGDDDDDDCNGDDDDDDSWDGKDCFSKSTSYGKSYGSSSYGKSYGSSSCGSSSSSYGNKSYGGSSYGSSSSSYGNKSYGGKSYGY